jgi:predicted nucleotidyltransferase
MNDFPKIKYRLHELKPELKRKYGVLKIGFFDRYIDTHHADHAELNLYIELERPLGWEFFGLKQFIEKRLELRIDICTPNALKPAFREEILANTHFV